MLFMRPLLGKPHHRHINNQANLSERTFVRAGNQATRKGINTVARRANDQAANIPAPIGASEAPDQSTNPTPNTNNRKWN